MTELGWCEITDMVAHKCITQEGEQIFLGMRVIDYDCRPGMVVELPDEILRPEFYGEPSKTCWSCAGNRGHWWGICPDREGHTHEIGKCRGSQFDGSRLTIRGLQ